MIKERIALLREWLKAKGFDAIVIPTNDPHFSEYVADYWKSRTWISGFTGSAGTVVVTLKEALLWCDSRYFVQSAMELEGTEYIIQKMGLKDTPSINEWFSTNINTGGRIAVDGKLFSISSFYDMLNTLTSNEVVATSDPFIDIWKDRPLMPSAPVRMLEVSDTGESICSKLERCCEGLALGGGIYITSVLDEIAWLFKLRGEDVPYNPVIISYAALSEKGAIIFADREKFSDEILTKLEKSSVTVRDYFEFDAFLETLSGVKVMINKNKFDIFHYNILTRVGALICPETLACGIITNLKATKNETELAGTRAAMVHDGVALVRFNMWLEVALEAGETITEYDVSVKLREFRSMSDTFVGESFNSIVGYGANGAIVHYSPTPDESAVIKADNFLLFDSGGQYNYGTTDITRTLHLSTPTDKQRDDYTLVLKGNISLATAVFPRGTTGHQLDILARAHLLRKGLNYGHGTGHGIGHLLNVHEGPQSIRMDYNPVALKEGMLTSNEPGLYREGEYGIRLETIIECVPFTKNEFGDFLTFRTITLYPFDLKCISLDSLSKYERRWLNRYHSDVFDTLSEYLNADEKLWLAEKTKAI